MMMKALLMLLMGSVMLIVGALNARAQLKSSRDSLAPEADYVRIGLQIPVWFFSLAAGFFWFFGLVAFAIIVPVIGLGIWTWRKTVPGEQAFEDFVPGIEWFAGYAEDSSTAMSLGVSVWCTFFGWLMLMGSAASLFLHIYG